MLGNVIFKHGHYNYTVHDSQGKKKHQQRYNKIYKLRNPACKNYEVIFVAFGAI